MAPLVQCRSSARNGALAPPPNNDVILAGEKLGYH